MVFMLISIMKYFATHSRSSDSTCLHNTIDGFATKPGSYTSSSNSLSIGHLLHSPIRGCWAITSNLCTYFSFKLDMEDHTLLYVDTVYLLFFALCRTCDVASSGVLSPLYCCIHNVVMRSTLGIHLYFEINMRKGSMGVLSIFWHFVSIFLDY